GERPGALTALETARAIRQKLCDDSPGVSSYRDELAGSLTALGDVLRTAGRGSEGAKAYGQAIAIRRALVQSVPQVTAYRSGLAGSLRRLGLSQPAAEAVTSWRRAGALDQGPPVLSPTDRL